MDYHNGQKKDTLILSGIGSLGPITGKLFYIEKKRH